jgi:predicted nuclease of predicted toxin-antitoxin system
MKFWIDENIPYSIVRALEHAGHETYIAPRRTDDLVILKRAREVNAVIITQDQDFEEYALQQKRSCAGIIWLRIARSDRPHELASKLVKVVKLHEEVLTESFITLSLYNVEAKRLK